MNLNALLVALAGIVIGGAIADALAPFAALVGGGVTVGGVLGALYAQLRERRRRTRQQPISWPPGDGRGDWHAAATQWGSYGGLVGLALAILDALIAA